MRHGVRGVQKYISIAFANITDFNEFTLSPKIKRWENQKFCYSEPEKQPYID